MLVKSNENLSQLLATSQWEITETTLTDDVQLGMSLPRQETLLLGPLCGHCYRKTYTDIPNPAVMLGGLGLPTVISPETLHISVAEVDMESRFPMNFWTSPEDICVNLTSKQLLVMRCLTLLYYAKITSSLFDLIPQQLHFLLSSFN